MSSEPVRRIGRGGAGNYYSQKDLQEATAQHEVLVSLAK
jgi:hypothetical protein